MRREIAAEQRGKNRLISLSLTRIERYEHPEAVRRVLSTAFLPLPSEHAAHLVQPPALLLEGEGTEPQRRVQNKSGRPCAGWAKSVSYSGNDKFNGKETDVAHQPDSSVIETVVQLLCEPGLSQMAEVVRILRPGEVFADR